MATHALERDEFVDPTSITKVHDVYDTSKRRRDSQEKHMYPGGLHPYERTWSYQLGMLLLLLTIAIANLRLNFGMIDLYDELLDDIVNLGEPEDVANAQDLLNEFNDLDDTDGVCDVDFFVNEFDTNELERLIRRGLRTVKASAYFTLGIGMWVTFLIRALSAYNLVTEDFNVTPVKQIKEHRRESAKNPGEADKERKEAENDPNDIANVIRTRAAKNKVTLETEGELKIRTYLRSETVLFGFNQVVQDIPILTSAILFIFFLIQKRGVLCFEAFVNGEVSNSFSTDEVDGRVLGQIAIILVNIFVMVVGNLGPRWVAYFTYKTVKNEAQPQSTSVRVFEVIFWMVAYFLAILTPFIAIIYSPVGTETLGLNTTGELGILVLLIIASVSLVMGAALFCCFWGQKFGESICVCFVVVEAFDVGCEACCEVEILELCPTPC